MITNGMGGERVCGSADLPQNFIRILAKKLVQITDSKHNSTQTANLSMGDQARKVQKVDGFGTKTVQIGESCTPFHPNFFLLGLQEFFFQNLPTPLKNEMVPKTKVRSEEHTSELQSRQYLVCRLLLEKKKN